MTLRKTIAWQSYHMKVVETVSDGSKALEWLEYNEVDIVFSDIKMPNIDGIELLKRGKLLYPQVQFVVISSFGAYNLVRDAFTSGSFDYIMKVDIDSPVIDELLTRLQERVSDRQEHQITHTIFSRFKELGTDVNDYRFCVVIIDKGFDIGELIEAETSFQFFSIQLHESILWILSYEPNKISFYNLISRLESVLNQNEQVYCGISSHGSFDDIELLHNYAVKSFDTAKFYQCPGTAFKYNKISSELVELRIEKLKEELKSDIMNVDLYRFSPKTRSFLQYLEDSYVLESSLKKTCATIIFYLACQLSEEGLLPEFYPRNLEMIKIKLSHLHFYKDVKMTIEELMRRLDAHFSKFRKNSLIKIVLLYLKYHYCENITLEELASLLGVSRGYLSRYFNSSTGVTLKHYINHLRIIKSKEYLLHSNLNISEICYELGYLNVEHFSRVFKKITGVSPSLYKKRGSKS